MKQNGWAMHFCKSLSLLHGAILQKRSKQSKEWISGFEQEKEKNQPRHTTALKMLKRVGPEGLDGNVVLQLQNPAEWRGFRLACKPYEEKGWPRYSEC